MVLRIFGAHLRQQRYFTTSATFSVPKKVKIALSEGQNLILSFDFGGQISAFRADNTPISEPVKVKNNSETTSEHLQNNFKKAQRTGFLTLKMVQNERLRMAQFDQEFWFAR